MLNDVFNCLGYLLQCNLLNKNTRDSLSGQEGTGAKVAAGVSFVCRVSIIQEVALEMKNKFEVSESFRETRNPLNFQWGWIYRHLNPLSNRLSCQTSVFSTKHKGALAELPSIFTVFV